jgi:hypothetical protein
MAEMNLPQAEADLLIAMEKHRVDEEHHDFPIVGQSLTLPLVSPDKREQFLLGITRGRIDLAKVTFLTRARQVIVLVRLDIAGPSHRNPDGEEMPCPHLHVYREECGDKWAMSVPVDKFPNIGDLWGTFEDFLRFCNITRAPHIQRGLFT